MTAKGARQEEKQLVKKMARGESSAWAEFLRDYGDLIYSHIAQVMHRRNFRIPEDEIGDVLQGLFERLVADNGRRLLSFEGRNGCSLSSWIRAVATNHTLGEMRKRRRTESLDEKTDEQVHVLMQDRGGSDSLSPREHSSLQELYERLDHAVSELSRREQLAFQLYYRDEYSGQEVAKVLGVATNTLDQILFQIRARLKKAMESAT